MNIAEILTLPFGRVPHDQPASRATHIERSAA